MTYVSNYLKRGFPQRISTGLRRTISTDLCPKTTKTNNFNWSFPRQFQSFLQTIRYTCPRQFQLTYATDNFKHTISTDLRPDNFNWPIPQTKWTDLCPKRRSTMVRTGIACSDLCSPAENTSLNSEESKQDVIQNKCYGNSIVQQAFFGNYIVSYGKYEDYYCFPILFSRFFSKSKFTRIRNPFQVLWESIYFDRRRLLGSADILKTRDLPVATSVHKYCIL